MDSGVLLTCIVCGRAFQEMEDLKLHIAIHNRVSHNCKICDQPFEFLIALQEHLQSHMWTGPNCCDKCPKSFTTASDLKRHTKKHISKQARHKCKQCKRTFDKEVHLERHVKVHTFGNLFPCEGCRKIFQKSRYLRNHIKRQHCTKSRITI